MFIPYGNHQIDDDDINAVVDVLKNHFLTQGQKVPEFEQAIADYCQVSYCTAVNSGTSALHVACLALGVTKGDRVWTTPNTFVASANCALYCGATIDFVDIDPATRNISLPELTKKLTQAKLTNSLPKVLMAVHFAGLPCDMKAIKALSNEFGFKIVEDASHALGSFYNELPVGNCLYSDFTVLSFHPVKPITTAEGGALLTNNECLYKRSGLFAKHGVTRAPDLIEDQYKSQDDGAWYYQQIELGYNYRLSDLQAALGLTQLTKLDGFINKRRQLWQRYTEKLAHLPLVLPIEPNYAKSGWHIYVVEVTNHDRQHVFNQLIEQGIGVQVHYIPVHLQPYYQKLGFSVGDFPCAEAYYAGAITLPLFPHLTFEQQDYVIATMESILG
ncbi:UDP-4-amino-4,6-dideoxy-N-acetyl-beta-L-altrosamine transaminase [Algibacillus agarilyticus]|uniref:UDP-4-amino-4, 6-dideoxy-N-acetyl-beta-L-altrosamine transaminase n=1 Tax=Algibacillus agarilyticus TaxID=2234133 RepID=UPI000DD08CBB|nr:UDP-4-amino-4,6-dideoxy-N-acetyl-beta-L-altrosamine transaminase [Algibacillus agarilyticus]